MRNTDRLTCFFDRIKLILLLGFGHTHIHYNAAQSWCRVRDLAVRVCFEIKWCWQHVVWCFSACGGCLFEFVRVCVSWRGARVIYMYTASLPFVPLQLQLLFPLQLQLLFPLHVYFLLLYQCFRPWRMWSGCYEGHRSLCGSFECPCLFQWR